LRWESFPAEDPEAEEGRFEEEGEQRLHGQRSAEDVADEAGVLAPRHAELELLDDAGGDAHHEVDEEELAPELRHPQILLVAGAVPHRLHVGDEEAEADRERHHEEVVDGGDAELPTPDIDCVHGSRAYEVTRICVAGAGRGGASTRHSDPPCLLSPWYRPKMPLAVRFSSENGCGLSLTRGG